MDLYKLISQDVVLRRVAATRGGEYAGACPFCGGTDRFRVWPDAERPGFWCRNCNKSGDAIQYLRERDGLNFREAHAAVQTLFGEELPIQKAPGKRSVPPAKPASPLSDDGSPSWEWQAQARCFCRTACRMLWWTSEGSQALAYLRGRGLSDEILRKALLGYHGVADYEAAQMWGHASNEKRVWQPQGIIIPWIVETSIWAIRIRSIHPGEMYRYAQIRGSRSALYRAGSIQKGMPAILVEGEFDALSIAQVVGETIAVVASGSTAGARQTFWLTQLAKASRVLVAFDADQAGDQAAQWWLERLSNAVRWRPCWEDSNSLLQQDCALLRTWVEYGMLQ